MYLSFAGGFVLGQISILIIIGAFIKYFIFESRQTERRGGRRKRNFEAYPATHPSPAGTQQTHEVHERSERGYGDNFAASGGSTDQHGGGGGGTSRILRIPPPASTASILRKTYYNVEAHAHAPESLDWFNVLVAQTLAQVRADAAADEDAILTSLSTLLNAPQKPAFFGEIRLTELGLGEDFPILSNCRVHAAPGVATGRPSSSSGASPGALQARMDVDLSDVLTLGLETDLLLNYPRSGSAVLPVSLTVSVVRFSGTLSISFVPGTTLAESGAPPTALAFSFMDDYRLDLAVRSLVGARSKLQDVPKIAQLVEARLHDWFDERCVEPRFQQIGLPSLWPRKKNVRGPESVNTGGSTEASPEKASADGSAGTPRDSIDYSPSRARGSGRGHVREARSLSSNPSTLTNAYNHMDVFGETLGSSGAENGYVEEKADPFTQDDPGLRRRQAQWQRQFTMPGSLPT